MSQLESSLLNPFTPSPLAPMKSAPPEEDDPFYYGWRAVLRTRPDGTKYLEHVPLTFDDVLFPEEDDYVVHKPIHDLDMDYCGGALMDCYVHVDRAVVLRDCRVDWGKAGVPATVPDITVLFGVRQWLRRHSPDQRGR